MRVTIALSLLAATACGTPETKPEAPIAEAGERGAQRIPDDTFDVSNLQKRALDLNRDGSPDAYQFFADVDGQARVVRKEIDVNFDGRIDLVRNLNKKGDLVEERLDQDFDGKIDLVIFFEKGAIVRKEYDTNFDAKVDMWRFFEQGAITRKEADLNYDGKVDYWEYFEGGKLDRIGIDRDSDGNVDEWERTQG
jgi:hypothetical protein